MDSCFFFAPPHKCVDDGAYLGMDRVGRAVRLQCRRNKRNRLLLLLLLCHVGPSIIIALGKREEKGPGKKWKKRRKIFFFQNAGAIEELLYRYSRTRISGSLWNLAK